MRWMIGWVLLATGIRAADLTAFPTADDLWKHLEQLQAGPTTKPTSREQARSIMRTLVTDLMAATQEFERRYPADPRLWEAKLTRVQAELIAAELDETEPDHAAAMTTLQAIAQAPAATATVQRNAAALAKQVRAEQQAARALVDLKSKPLDLKFTALDGREVDLAKLRGKVVLVDFWATWCPPCRAEMPQVTATYRQLREKGFEIVGISLDSSKDKLLAFTKQHNMTWPQYYDGKGWENELSNRFNVQSIPTAWLVDKTGKLRHTDVRAETLAKQVEQLLAE